MAKRGRGLLILGAIAGCFLGGIGLSGEARAQTQPQPQSGYAAAQRALAERHAPLIWLAQDQPWLPSSVDFFAANVTAVCNGQTISTDILTLTAAQLPDNQSDEDLQLVTRQPLAGPTTGRPF